MWEECCMHALVLLLHRCVCGCVDKDGGWGGIGKGLQEDMGESTRPPSAAACL